AGRDLAEERHAEGAAEQREAWAAPRAAALHAQFAFRLQRPQVLAPGGVGDAEAPCQGRQFGEGRGALVAGAQGLPDQQWANGAWWHGGRPAHHPPQRRVTTGESDAGRVSSVGTVLETSKSWLAPPAEPLAAQWTCTPARARRRGT